MPLSPTDLFNEALAYVPMMHVPVGQNQHVLVIGAAAAAAVQVAIRYPTFAEILVTTDVDLSGLRDPRVHVIPRLADLPPSWKADLIVVAVPSVTLELLQMLRLHSNRNTVLVVAVPAADQARAIKQMMRPFWVVIAPYREHLPAPNYFMLASDAPLSRYRAIPPAARRLSEKYVPALFTFAKDEYSALYGAA